MHYYFQLFCHSLLICMYTVLKTLQYFGEHLYMFLLKVIDFCLLYVYSESDAIIRFQAG